LDGRGETVDLVHEEDVPWLKVRQDPGEVSRAREHRTRSQAQPRAHFPRDDVGERRLAEPRRPRQQDVVERLAAAPRGFPEGVEVLADLRLADVLRKRLRTELGFDGSVVLQSRAGEDGLFVGHRKVDGRQSTGKSTVDSQQSTVGLRALLSTVDCRLLTLSYPP